MKKIPEYFSTAQSGIESLIVGSNRLFKEGTLLEFFRPVSFFSYGKKYVVYGNAVISKQGLSWQPGAQIFEQR